jgi:hypothetical protein
MQLQKRIYLGKKGYPLLKSIGVSASQICELKQLDSGVPISIYRELQRLQQAALKPVSQQSAQH